MFAICSDLDETPSKQVYFEMMRYLNTNDRTQIGIGVGLEVGNTIYFDMPAEQFSYWNTDNDGREKVRKLIKSGHIDCLHSFGDNATDRTLAERDIQELQNNQCFIKVWVDHAQAVTNLGEDIMQGYGDVPGHNAYHADILLEYGIRYIWKGRITSLIGQETERSYKAILNKNIIKSGKTLSKQIIKDLAGKLGSRKYYFHRDNSLLKEVKLRNGASTKEFIRCNPYWGGVENAATADGFAEVITNKFLDQLERSSGMCILYTHLGKITDKQNIFSEGTKNAFLTIKRYAEKKSLLVTTTSRLLEYCSLVKDMQIDKKEKGSNIDIYIQYDGDIDSLQGLTIASNRKARHKIIKNKEQSIEMQEIGNRSNGDWLYSIPWKKLEYPM
jgi:hypothetical protein